MKYLFYLLVLLLNTFFEPIQGQCSGGIWPIDDTNIGSFTVSWRYNMASNTVQFIIQGKAKDSINLATTYVALGWSDTAPTMNNMDVAMFFPGTQIVQDRYSRAHAVPSVDTHQDFCVIRTNITDQNLYVEFERFIITGDTNDISFIPNLYLMFSMGLYTVTTSTNTFNPQQHFFQTVLPTITNLINCVSNACLSTNCSVASCPCLQQITSGSAQCTCFPPSPCVSGSTVTNRTTISTSTTTSPISTTARSPCQCMNGGTCLTNGTCLCPNGYRGKFCQINTPCLDYCRNNGTCSVICTDTLCGIPNCVCVNGTSGLRCETNVGNSCQPNPCVHGNCTTVTNGSFQCQCNNGFFGTRCQMIDSCLSNPCSQGTCIRSTNCQNLLCGYTCLCPNGTAGTNCGIGGNPCLSSPCKNTGSCSILSSSYLCTCSPPYAGPNCELIINVCTPNPCFNGGTCVRSVNVLDGAYQCQCLNSFTGTKCEYLNPCISAPCRNGGQCVPSTTNCLSSGCSVSCICLTGTTGAYCEQVNTSCITLPCFNGGICLTNPLSSISYCQCPSNTTGTRCETIQSICTTAVCSNNGVCYIDASYGNNTLRCVCPQGYTGQYCQSSLNISNSCSQNPCGSNGTCISLSNSAYNCICPNGLIAQSCSSNTLTSCSGSPCQYLSTCQPIPNTNPINYQCVCPDYLTGNRCQYTNMCQKQPCYNQGSCIPLGAQNNYMCLCQPGFGQYDCSIYLGLSCNSNICLNGGTCDYNNTYIRCICPIGFTGVKCEWTSVCSTDTCLNGGTCRQIASTMAECLCATGFTGPTCSLRDSCANFPCKNGAGCTPLLTDTGTNWSAYRCVCPPGIYGQNCDTPINSCANTVCPSYKICSEQPTGAICTCSGSKVGTFCQYDNPCGVSSSTYCSNGGTCVSSNTDPPIATCLCREGFTGLYCNITDQHGPCAKNPCHSHGYCTLSASNTSYSCICQTNYTGNQCERPNPCLSSPCLNAAVCQVYWNTTDTWFTCQCVDTFTGTRCETSLLNPCSGLCMNGSPCINGTCVCPPQYTGKFCGYNNPCQRSPCRNGGLCTSDFNSTSVSFTCTCASPYTGQYCENYMVAQTTGSCALPCLNSGTCVKGECMCTSQYVGPLCQYGNPCINNNPCLNSGTCFGRYNISRTLYTQCFCLQGYTGVNCEATICSSTSCNGGVCTATQNTFVCQCPTGQVGDRCQYADVCASNPCLSTERCEQTTNFYQCISCYDKSTYCSTYQNHTEYCTNYYAILINGIYLPVLDACQRSCSQCISVQRFNDMNSLAAINKGGNLALGEQENYTIEMTTTTTSSSTTTTTPPGQNIIFSREDN